MNASLFAQAARLYCDNQERILVSTIPDVLVARTGASPAEVADAMSELQTLIKFCVDKVHWTYSAHLGSEEPAREALYHRAPEVDQDVLDCIYRYSSWCVAKGA